MSQKFIKRITLFKIPNEEDIVTVLEQYKTLQANAVKNGKPYILSCEAGKTINTSEDRSQGYTLCAQTKFSSLEDVHYYDNECEAHQKLKAVAAKVRTGAAVMLFESEAPPPTNS